MGEDNNLWYTLNNWNGYSTNTTWTTATLSANNSVTYGESYNDKIKKLENEIKDLKKRMSRLTTLILTYIGEEQLEKFNDENK